MTRKDMFQNQSAHKSLSTTLKKSLAQGLRNAMHAVLIVGIFLGTLPRQANSHTVLTMADHHFQEAALDNFLLYTPKGEPFYKSPSLADAWAAEKTEPHGTFALDQKTASPFLTGTDPSFVTGNSSEGLLSEVHEYHYETFDKYLSGKAGAYHPADYFRVIPQVVPGDFAQSAAVAERTALTEEARRYDLALRDFYEQHPDLAGIDPKDLPSDGPQPPTLSQHERDGILAGSGEAIADKRAKANLKWLSNLRVDDLVIRTRDKDGKVTAELPIVQFRFATLLGKSLGLKTTAYNAFPKDGAGFEIVFGGKVVNQFNIPFNSLAIYDGRIFFSDANPNEISFISLDAFEHDIGRAALPVFRLSDAQWDTKKNITPETRFELAYGELHYGEEKIHTNHVQFFEEFGQSIFNTQVSLIDPEKHAAIADSVDLFQQYWAHGARLAEAELFSHGHEDHPVDGLLENYFGDMDSALRNSLKLEDFAANEHSKASTEIITRQLEQWNAHNGNKSKLYTRIMHIWSNVQAPTPQGAAKLRSGLGLFAAQLGAEKAGFRGAQLREARNRIFASRYGKLATYGALYAASYVVFPEEVWTMTLNTAQTMQNALSVLWSAAKASVIWLAPTTFYEAYLRGERFGKFAHAITALAALFLSIIAIPMVLSNSYYFVKESPKYFKTYGERSYKDFYKAIIREGYWKDNVPALSKKLTLDAVKFIPRLWTGFINHQEEKRERFAKDNARAEAERRGLDKERKFTAEENEIAAKVAKDIRAKYLKVKEKTPNSKKSKKGQIDNSEYEDMLGSDSSSAKPSTLIPPGSSKTEINSDQISDQRNDIADLADTSETISIYPKPPETIDSEVASVRGPERSDAWTPKTNSGQIDTSEVSSALPTKPKTAVRIKFRNKTTAFAHEIRKMMRAIKYSLVGDASVDNMHGVLVPSWSVWAGVRTFYYKVRLLGTMIYYPNFYRRVIPKIESFIPMDKLPAARAASKWNGGLTPIYQVFFDSLKNLPRPEARRKIKNFERKISNLELKIQGHVLRRAYAHMVREMQVSEDVHNLFRVPGGFHSVSQKDLFKIRGAARIFFSAYYNRMIGPTTRAVVENITIAALADEKAALSVPPVDDTEELERAFEKQKLARIQDVIQLPQKELKKLAIETLDAYQSRLDEEARKKRIADERLSKNPPPDRAKTAYEAALERRAKKEEALSKLDAFDIGDSTIQTLVEQVEKSNHVLQEAREDMRVGETKALADLASGWQSFQEMKKDLGRKMDSHAMATKTMFDMHTFDMVNSLASTPMVKRLQIVASQMHNMGARTRAVRGFQSHVTVDLWTSSFLTFAALSGVTEGLSRPMYDEKFSDQSWHYLSTAVWFSAGVGLSMELAGGVWLKLLNDARQQNSFGEIPRGEDANASIVRYYYKMLGKPENSMMANHIQNMEIAWANMPAAFITMLTIDMISQGRFDLDTYLMGYIYSFCNPLYSSLALKADQTFELAAGKPAEMIPVGYDHLIAHPVVGEAMREAQLRLRRRFNLMAVPAFEIAGNFWHLTKTLDVASVGPRAGARVMFGGKMAAEWVATGAHKTASVLKDTTGIDAHALTSKCMQLILRNNRQIQKSPIAPVFSD